MARPTPSAVANANAINESSVVGTAWCNKSGHTRHNSAAISVGGGNMTGGTRNAVTAICQINKNAPAVAIGRITGRSFSRLDVIAGPVNARAEAALSGEAIVLSAVIRQIPV